MKGKWLASLALSLICYGVGVESAVRWGRLAGWVAMIASLVVVGGIGVLWEYVDGEKAAP